MKSPILAVILAATVSVAGLSSAARADAGHAHQLSIGTPGKKIDAKRVMTIVMRENVYDQESITVKEGETIHFILRNAGELLHEFNIGTAAMHATHQQEMMKMMEMGMLTPVGLNMNVDHAAMGHSAADTAGMKHDDPNSVLIEPGKTKELVWKFAKAGKLEFACNVPGHYHTGMVGQFKFER